MEILAWHGTLPCRPATAAGAVQFVWVSGQDFGGDRVDDKTGKDMSKFDWVTERSLCSLPKVFKDLRLQVEEDVKTRNALRPDNSPYEFSVAGKGSGFTVLLESKDVHRSVIFCLSDHAILVQDDKGNKMFEVTPTFNDEGECRLKVNAEERDLWQVRRMALEELLFRD
jgi:hypothetical protein